MTTVLITGVNGFIGNALASRLIRDGKCKVIGVDRPSQAGGFVSDIKAQRVVLADVTGQYEYRECDLRNWKDVLTLIAETCPDYVVHFAGQYSVTHTTKAALSYAENNLLATSYLLEACKLQKIRKFIYASSVAAEAQVAMYGSTKAACELVGLQYMRQFGQQFVAIRYCTAYGPWTRPDMQIYQLIDSSLTGRRIRLPDYNHGGHSIYVDDAIEATVRFMNFPVVGIHTLLSPTACNLFYIAGVIAGITGKPVNWIDPPKDFNEMEQANIYDTDCQALIDTINYVPNTDLLTGLQKMIDWFKEIKKIQ